MAGSRPPRAGKNDTMSSFRGSRSAQVANLAESVPKGLRDVMASDAHLHASRLPAGQMIDVAQGIDLTFDQLGHLLGNLILVSCAMVGFPP